MKDIQSTIQKEIKKLWPQAEKSIAQLNKDTQKFMKETEKTLAATYKKTKKTTEEVIFKAQREKLYYDLGRAVLPLLSAEQLKNKRIAPMVQEIRKLSRRIRSKK